MLINQIQETVGVASSTVVLTGQTISNIAVTTPCNSGIVLNGTGILAHILSNGAFSAISGEWLVVGDPEDFWLERKIISGTLNGADAGAGILQLNVSRTFINLRSAVGTKTTVVDFEIFSDSGGINSVLTARFTFVSERITTS